LDCPPVIVPVNVGAPQLYLVSIGTTPCKTFTGEKANPIPELAVSCWVCIIGIGKTVMLNDIGFPAQELVNGVTVIIPAIGAFDGFVAVNARMFPVPVEEAKPMEGLLFVQVYSVFTTREPLKTMLFVRVPLQIP